MLTSLIKTRLANTANPETANKEILQAIRNEMQVENEEKNETALDLINAIIPASSLNFHFGKSLLVDITKIKKPNRDAESKETLMDLILNKFKQSDVAADQKLVIDFNTTQITPVVAVLTNKENELKELFSSEYKAKKANENNYFSMQFHEYAPDKCYVAILQSQIIHPHLHFGATVLAIAGPLMRVVKKLDILDVSAYKLDNTLTPKKYAENIKLELANIISKHLPIQEYTHLQFSEAIEKHVAALGASIFTCDMVEHAILALSDVHEIPPESHYMNASDTMTTVLQIKFPKENMKTVLQKLQSKFTVKDAYILSTGFLEFHITATSLMKEIENIKAECDRLVTDNRDTYIKNSVKIEDVTESYSNPRLK